MAKPKPSEFEGIESVVAEIDQIEKPLTGVILQPAKKNGVGNHVGSLPAKTRQIAISDDRDPWEQQDGESIRNFKIFEYFLALGLTRSVSRVVRELQLAKNSDKKTISARNAALSRMAWIYRWGQRAVTYDQQQLTAITDKKKEVMDSFQTHLVGYMDKAIKEIDKIQDEPNPAKRKQMLTDAAPMIMLVLGRGGLKTLLEGHKTVFGEKYKIDIEQKSVRLDFKFAPFENNDAKD